MSWSVVKDDLWSPIEVFLFDTEQQAMDFVKADYAECLADEIKEQSGWDGDERTLREDECHCDVDEGFGYACMSWETEWTGSHPDERDTRTWNVVEAKDMMNKEEK